MSDYLLEEGLASGDPTLIEAASAPTFALRPHHCGSAMVAMALQPDSASSVPEMTAGAGPHTKEK